jgi:hypothetical protein
VALVIWKLITMINMMMNQVLKRFRPKSVWCLGTGGRRCHDHNYEEVEEDIVIQEDASEFDAEVEVEEIDEIYVSDEEPPADTNSVEIISLSLITIRTESDGINSVKREHHFSTSKHHYPRNFNWRDFLSYMEEELCRHAEALRKRVADVQEL